MGCCVLGAMLITQALASWHRLRSMRLRLLLAVLPALLGTGLLTYHFEHLAIWYRSAWLGEAVVVEHGAGHSH